VYESYLKNGFCKLNVSFLNERKFLFERELCLIINHLLIKEAPNFFKVETLDIFLDDLYPKLRITHPNLASKIYDVVTRMVSFQHIFQAPELLKKFEELFLNDSNIAFALNNYQLYLQSPLDETNINGVHQDSSYFGTMCSPNNSFVLWMPFRNVDKDSGAIEVIRGSHKNGLLPHLQNTIENRKSGKRNTKGFNYLDSNFYNENEFESVDCSSEEAIIMNFNLIHRSGLNTSTRTRMVLLSRFSNIYSPDYF